MGMMPPSERMPRAAAPDDQGDKGIRGTEGKETCVTTPPCGYERRPPPPSGSRDATAWAVFTIFLGLGCGAFGGPVAHLARFRQEFVDRRRWLDGRSYTDLLAFAQVLPGPASSQVGMALGLLRAGLPGMLAAWLGFTLPSALLMLILGLALRGPGAVAAGGTAVTALSPAVIHGLKLVAVAVVADALRRMLLDLGLTRWRAGLVLASTLTALLLPGLPGQLLPMLACAVAAWCHPTAIAPPTPVPPGGGDAVTDIPRRERPLVLSGGLLLALLVAGWADSRPALLAARFFQVGAMVFGGGHVVLPLLSRLTVDSGWIDGARFMAGYGAAQALPGPLFAYAAYLGTLVAGVPGALAAVLGIFAPSFFLVPGLLPYWGRLRRHAGAWTVLDGITLAVVGLLLAAFCWPLLPDAVGNVGDVLVAGLLLVIIMRGWAPIWGVVASVPALFLLAGMFQA